MRARKKLLLASLCLFIVCSVSALTLWVVAPKDAQSALDRGYYKKAAHLLEDQAKAGDTDAQNTLGSLYYLGLGVEQNQKLASKWFLESALGGNTDAQVNIARQYQYGHGLKRDEMRAFGWYRQARINNNEVAEIYMKWIAGGMILGPLQMQRAVEIYKNLEDLVPSEEKGGL